MDFRGYADSELDTLARTMPTQTTLPRWQRKALEQQQAQAAQTTTPQQQTPKAQRAAAPGTPGSPALLGKTPRKTPQVRPRHAATQRPRARR